MQQVQQRELPERISWARALIFAIGFFFLAAIMIGQLPGYIYLQMTAATLEGLIRGELALAVVFLGGFAVILTIVSLFDPKPVVPPTLFTGLGAILSLLALGLIFWATLTGCTPTTPACNQYYPNQNLPELFPVLGGRFLWFQPNTIDLVMIGLGVLGVGAAMIFYSVLAIREQRNPERYDPGTTPTIRWMLVVGSILLVLFIVLNTLFNTEGLVERLFPTQPFVGTRLLDLIGAVILGTAVLMTLGALALRLHYLMRPARKRTMAPLYAYGAFGLAQLGLVMLVLWFITYPLIAWMHSWTFIGLGDYLTVCATKTAIPASCSFSAQSGYIVDALVTTNNFALLVAAIWGWKTKRNLVVIGCILTVAVLAAATFLIHTGPEQILVAMVLTAGMLILGVVWTSSARREFAVVGENNLGCLGQWLLMGSCLFIYLASFAFFSIPIFEGETEPNIPYTPGLIVQAPTPAGQTPVLPAADAVVMLLIMAILGAIQFYFLTRNRYKV